MGDYNEFVEITSIGNSDWELIGWYKFELDFRDYSGNNNNLTNNSNILFTSNGGGIRDNYAIIFNDQYLSIPSSNIDLSKHAWTIAVWVKTTITGTDQYILSQGKVGAQKIFTLKLVK